MNGVVLDASAALALLIDEPARRGVEDQLHARQEAGATVLVPSVFWLEVVNVLTHRYHLDGATVTEAVYELEQLGIVTADAGRTMTLAVIDAIARSGLSAYDAAYLVLADASNAELITADVALAAAAGDRAALVGHGPSVREAPGTYRTDPLWTRWRGAGAYLAQLRADLESP